MHIKVVPYEKSYCSCTRRYQRGAGKVRFHASDSILVGTNSISCVVCMRTIGDGICMILLKVRIGWVIKMQYIT